MQCMPDSLHYTDVNPEKLHCSQINDFGTYTPVYYSKRYNGTWRIVTQIQHKTVADEHIFSIQQRMNYLLNWDLINLLTFTRVNKYQPGLWFSKNQKFYLTYQHISSY